MFPHDYVCVTHLGQDYHRSDAMISLRLIRWHMISVCPTADHGHLDHWIKMVFEEMVGSRPGARNILLCLERLVT